MSTIFFPEQLTLVAWFAFVWLVWMFGADLLAWWNDKNGPDQMA